MGEVRTASGPGTTKEEPPYVIISNIQLEPLQKKLLELAAKGYRPILMSSCASPRGVEITVVLEL